MPARLLMVNPGKPRKKAAKKKKASAAQLRARKRFAAMAKSGSFKKAKKKTARKNPAKKKTAKKVTRKKATKKKAKKKTVRKKTTRRKPRKAKEASVARKRTKKRSTKRRTAKRRPARKKSTTRRRRRRANPSKPRKRRARRATARRRAPARKRTAQRRRRRNPSSKRSAAARRGWAKRTGRKLKSARRAAKRAPRRSGRRAVQRARSSALSVKRRAQAGGLSSSARSMAKKYGLMRVNPRDGFTKFLKDSVALIPAVGIGVGGAVVIGMGGGYVDKMAKEWAAKQPDPVKSANSFPVKYAAPLATGSLTALTYALMRMGKKTSQWSGFVLASGWTLTALQILSRWMVKEKDEAGVESGEVSLGSKLGLPIGEYVAIGAYSQPDPNLMVDGADVRLNGNGHYSMGDYVADPSIGEYVAIGAAGNTFDGSSLGAAQMGYGREGQRGTANIPTAAEILEEGDAEGGVLSGSIFDSW